MIRKSYIPADSCIFCGKTIREVGGRMLLSMEFRGYLISDKPLSGGNKKWPYRNRLMSNGKWFICWDGDGRWTEDKISEAVKSLEDNRSPWICQCCGHRLCKKCSTPIYNPQGYDVIKTNGEVIHFGLMAPSLCPECNKESVKRLRDEND